MRPLIADRATSGAYQSLLLEMKEIERQSFGFARMSPNRFDHLLKLIKPMIKKKNAVTAPIPSDERNSLMMYEFHHLLRTLGESQKSLSYYFTIGKTTVCGIINCMLLQLYVEEVCEAIWKHTLKAVPAN